MEDPFTPNPPQGFGPDQLAQQFAFLDDPKARAALLSTGISLMQPPSFGDTFSSQLGRAIGSGGESVARLEAQDRLQQEADSKAALRESQAATAGARSETAGANANIATQRLALERERMGALNDRNRTNNLMRFSSIYQQYVRDTHRANKLIEDQNTNPFRTRGFEPKPLLPIQTPEEFVAARPHLAGAGIMPTPQAAQGSSSDPISAARDAISQGAPRDAVIRRLQEKGISVPGDL